VRQKEKLKRKCRQNNKEILKHQFETEDRARVHFHNGIKNEILNGALHLGKA
jgi:hypothetical protein